MTKGPNAAGIQAAQVALTQSHQSRRILQACQRTDTQRHLHLGQGHHHSNLQSPSPVIIAEGNHNHPQLGRHQYHPDMTFHYIT